MLLNRILTYLFDHAVKIVAGVMVLGGLVVWLTMPDTPPVSTLQARCEEKQLPVRVIRLEPSSHQERRFLAMVPGGYRERLKDGYWAFCRANLEISTPEGPQHEGR